jgi:hypothetical protein
LTILSSKLQEIGFIKVQGQQLLLNNSLIPAKKVLTLAESSPDLGLVIIIPKSSAHKTQLALLDVIMGKSDINNKRIRYQELLLVVRHV